MSKPIDQEREALPELKSWSAFADALGLNFYMSDTLWQNALSLYEKITSARASVQPAGGAVPVMQFQMKHPSSGEAYMVEFTREEVADGLEDQLYEKLGELVCDCGGEADHECGDYIHDFELQAVAPHPVSGEQKALSVQITGHLDEVDAPVWPFINAEARKLGPATGSIDTYNFTRPDGAQPNGVVAVLWNGMSIHALALTVRDSLNRTQCVRLLAAPPAAQDVTGLAEAVRDYLSAVHEQLPNPLKVTAAMLQMKKALAAHRAQQSQFCDGHCSALSPHPECVLCRDGRTQQGEQP